MKKSFLIVCLVLLIVIIICFVGIKLNSKTNIAITQQNKEYEQYLNSEIYGTDVITLINKAISSNESNNIQKDEKEFYINNNSNSIQIDLVMITNEEKQETTTYKMEKISKVGITKFIQNFNTAKFKCTKKEYHQETGKISNITLEQLYE